MIRMKIVLFGLECLGLDTTLWIRHYAYDMSQMQVCAHDKLLSVIYYRFQVIYPYHLGLNPNHTTEPCRRFIFGNK